MTTAPVVLLTFSICAVIVATSLFIIGSLFSEAQSLLTGSLREMAEFKYLANDAWIKMSTANTAAFFRTKRSSLGCTCSLEEENPCPPGAQGPKGTQGQQGLPGIPGEPGREGASGLGLQDRPGGCVLCPVGEPGPEGAPGAPGEPGPDGDDGLPGGIQGPPGPPGDKGQKGPKGVQGEKGTRGLDGGRCIKRPPSRPGVRGAPGARGNPGPDGEPGRDGKDGNDGWPGLDGMDGVPGEDGAPGGYGEIGLPGDDATYCACPHRSGEVVQEVNAADSTMESERSKRLEFHQIPKARIIY